MSRGLFKCVYVCMNASVCVRQCVCVCALSERARESERLRRRSECLLEGSIVFYLVGVG